MTVGTVWFVGAGPGDPELITVKGRSLIERAGAILFAGSLVNEAVTRWAPPGCTIADSKDMTLEQMAAWLIAQAQQHAVVIRLQTGDPALYGALIEVVQPLDAAGVPVRVVPGVSSAMASAAAAVESFTLPEVTQSVIFTRVEGRTPMPEGESLALCTTSMGASSAQPAARNCSCTLCSRVMDRKMHSVQWWRARPLCTDPAPGIRARGSGHVSGFPEFVRNGVQLGRIQESDHGRSAGQEPDGPLSWADHHPPACRP